MCLMIAVGYVVGSSGGLFAANTKRQLHAEVYSPSGIKLSGRAYRACRSLIDTAFGVSAIFSDQAFRIRSLHERVRLVGVDRKALNVKL
jgi:hypothetical protein